MVSPWTLLHWILVAFGTLVAYAIIKQIRNPPQEIEWSEVPEVK